MLLKNALFRRTLIASCAVALLLLPAVGQNPTFIPDVTFQGSGLTGWHSLGDAAWRAEDGVITGTPKSPGGGWLLLDKPLQDSGFYASFKCAGGCVTAVMVRAEEGDDRLSRRLRRQQLAPDHDGFRQGGSAKVPQYHRL